MPAAAVSVFGRAREPVMREIIIDKQSGRAFPMRSGEYLGKH